MHILASGRITITRAGERADDVTERTYQKDKEVIFKNCAPFTTCISEINNMQVDDAQEIDVVLPIYNIFEYSDNYWKTSGSLWQY